MLEQRYHPTPDSEIDEMKPKELRFIALIALNKNKMYRSAHASFTLNENNEGVLMKEDEVFDDVTQNLNKQSRVEDSSRANVISLEKICKRQGCQGMVECSESPGANISPANYEL